MKDYKGAVEDFTQAIQLNPDLAEAYSLRSLVRYDLGDKKGAIEDSTQAIRIAPDNAKAYLIRGRVRDDLGDKQGARNDYYVANSLVPCLGPTACGGGSPLIPGNPATYYNRGRALARRGDKQGAIVNLQQAAVLFRAQGNTNRYRETQNLISQLQR
jgi:tetratricopeptide (TPR) repeat protein